MNLGEKNKNFWTEENACRLCGGANLLTVVDLGFQPPANSLHALSDEPVPTAPLKLVHCTECKVVQLTATVDPKYLFSNYVWVTATSSTARNYSKFFCNEVLKRTSLLTPFVVEIASNDGTFLSQFKTKGSKILGVDPAINIASHATASGIPTIPQFFDENIAKVILEEFGQPSLVIARNVIPHVNDIHSIIKGLAKLAGQSGIVVIEFHYAKSIVEELHYDSIYHEHLFYFSLKTLTDLFSRYGLNGFDVFASPISGGSLVLFLSKSAIQNSKLYNELIAQEESTCLNDIGTWQQFGQASIQHAKELKNLVVEYSKGGSLIGYGASARSSTLMNYVGITNKEIACILDRNPLKHGLFTPGTNIPIISYEKGLETIKGSNVILLAWNFENEVVKDLRSIGFIGDIIVPLPNNIHIR